MSHNMPDRPPVSAHLLFALFREGFKAAYNICVVKLRKMGARQMRKGENFKIGMTKPQARVVCIVGAVRAPLLSRG